MASSRRRSNAEGVIPNFLEKAVFARVEEIWRLATPVDAILKRVALLKRRLLSHHSAHEQGFARRRRRPGAQNEKPLRDEGKIQASSRRLTRQA